MEKITKEQFDIMLNSRGYKPNKFALAIEKCKVNEGIIIKKEDWHIKTLPAVSLANKNAYLKLHGIRIKTKNLEDKSGWAILRIT